MSKETQGPNVHLFTDGACSGNPGPGGWAYILRHLRTGTEKVASGGQLETTNNQMELLAVIAGLEALHRSCSVEVYTDRFYFGKGLLEWMPKWKRNGWQRREGKKMVPVKNVELWQRLDQVAQKHRIKYTRVAGHSGHPENEKCDQLAVEACEKIKRGGGV